MTETRRPAEKPGAPPMTRKAPPAPVAGKPAVMTAEEQMRSDPVGYLRKVAERAKGIPAYRVTFYRQERLGLVPTLRKMEKIAAAFRAEPFSVYFRWEEADSEYAQAAFVRGANDDKVVLLPRKGLLGLPAAPGKFNPQDAVSFQKSRNPITDFGVARMMERTLARIEAARADGGTVGYQGVRLAGQGQRPAYLFAMTFPASDPYPNKSMELYIDQQTELPIGVYLRLPNGKLDAMYLYEDLDSAVSLTSGDFEIVMPEKTSKAKMKSES